MSGEGVNKLGILESDEHGQLLQGCAHVFMVKHGCYKAKPRYVAERMINQQNWTKETFCMPRTVFLLQKNALNI